MTRAELAAISPDSSALRRCRQPVPARVAVAEGRPVRVTTDRRGFAGGAVTHCAGHGGHRETGGLEGQVRRSTGRAGKDRSGHSTLPTRLPHAGWNRDEWDVALSDGAVYRIFQDRDTDAWFIDAIVD